MTFEEKVKQLKSEIETREEERKEIWSKIEADMAEIDQLFAKGGLLNCEEA